MFMPARKLDGKWRCDSNLGTPVWDTSKPSSGLICYATMPIWKYLKAKSKHIDSTKGVGKTETNGVLGPAVPMMQGTGALGMRASPSLQACREEDDTSQGTALDDKTTAMLRAKMGMGRLFSTLKCLSTLEPSA